MKLTNSFALLSLLCAGFASAELADLGVLSKALGPKAVAEHKLAADQGFRITQVSEGSSAAKLGLQKGDIVTKLGGRPVYSASSLAQVVASGYAEGEEVELEWIREGETMSGKVVLEGTTTADELFAKNTFGNLPGGAGGQFADLAALAQGAGGAIVIDGTEDLPEDLEKMLKGAGIDLGDVLQGALAGNGVAGVGVSSSVILDDGNGSISVGSPDQEGRRRVVIKDQDGKKVFGGKILESEIDEQIPEEKRETLKNIFSGNGLNLDLSGAGFQIPGGAKEGSGEADTETKDLLEKLEEKETE